MEKGELINSIILNKVDNYRKSRKTNRITYPEAIPRHFREAYTSKKEAFKTLN